MGDFKLLLRRLALAAVVWLGTSAATPPPVALTIESWRDGDAAVWRERLIPAFEKSHPGIKLAYRPTDTADYDKAVESRFDKGLAGDVIACRPFERSRQWFRKGRLLPLDGVRGMSGFTAHAKRAWSSAEPPRTAFCVPVASVMHGFVYNAEAFGLLRLGAPPATWDAFEALLARLKADGRFIPLVMGTQDPWEAATVGYQTIAPNAYGGEAGRQALLAGQGRLTDPPWVEPFRALSRWRPFLGDGFQAQGRLDSRSLFLLGMGAIYPAGSWEVAELEKRAAFVLGAFKSPALRQGDDCHVLEHPEIALGINAKSPHRRQAEVFLEWVASPEFAALYANALPGFFSLQTAGTELRSPLARQFLSWRGQCATTPRWTQDLAGPRAVQDLQAALEQASAAVVEGVLTPEQAAARLQEVWSQRVEAPPAPR